MLQTMIHFPGNCNEAISFYKEVLGAEVKVINYFKDAPADSGMEGLADDFVMHSEVKILDSILVMTDGAEKRPNGDNFCFMIIKETENEVSELFNKLAEGGNIIVPLGPQFWAPTYGMVEDKYGVTWQIMTTEEGSN